MISDSPRDIAARSLVRSAPSFDVRTRRQMVGLREAFRLHRLVQNQRRLIGLFDEHSMLTEARGARIEMMRLLLAARSSWRIALGIST